MAYSRRCDAIASMTQSLPRVDPLMAGAVQCAGSFSNVAMPAGIAWNSCLSQV
jgi:hypothetical protein